MINTKNLNIEGAAIEHNLAARNYQLPLANILAQQTQLKQLRNEEEKINALINKNQHTPLDKEQLKNVQAQLKVVQTDFDTLTHYIPNILHETVPKGKGAEDNVVIKVVGDTIPTPLKDYIEKGKAKGLDIEAGVDMAGTRFTVLRKQLAKHQRKIINEALDFYEACGYEEIYVPHLVREDILFGTGQYPKFKDDMFKVIHNDKPLYLIPTGEVPLTNLVRNKIFKETEVAQKFMTRTPCFRQEAGAAGRDTKGILRQHQFEKVELVRTCLPEHGLQNLEDMLGEIEGFIAQLGLRYRIIELCAGDIGFAGHKAYDIEVWFNYEKTWREIATITWCHDFQARRMNAKFKRNTVGKKAEKEYLHTLNGTGLAAGRVLAALLDQELC